MIRRFLATVAVALGLSAGAAGATGAKPDYSAVTSREAADRLVSQGKLFKILLFPAEFGGEARPENIVYVPAGIPGIKDQLTGTLVRFVKQDLIDNLRVEPEYKGHSLVPARIRMFTTHKDKAGSFNPVIEIW